MYVDVVLCVLIALSSCSSSETDLLIAAQQGPVSNHAAAMFHINKAVDALKAIADTSVDNTVIPVDSQHADMLGKAQQLEQAAKKAVFGSQEWAMAVQELTKLVASVHVASQLSAAEAELSAHRKSCTAATIKFGQDAEQIALAVQMLVATFKEKRSVLVVKGETVSKWRAQKRVHDQLCSIVCRAMSADSGK